LITLDNDYPLNSLNSALIAGVHFELYDLWDYQILSSEE
jgi:hypothetical protein